ncbi:HAD-IIIA family hydrolase [Shimazuella sp. AN120528]|uniref:HAD-IIIA family hydrolase n=1 Tax=Shimazuella soli TaxID=1892854 RepID=UPI001F108BDE|nr:HAD-IIIA family hydrolase [Shimazuella soli]MCH5586656.1 HAD-IIIA family hydrolase [Shimazuella soli]
MQSHKAVFLDRDGTIGGGKTVQYPGEFILFPYTLKCIHFLKQAGFFVFTFTNQPGIERGEAQLGMFEKELASFGFDALYICPHKPETGCTCRKPGTGLLEQAAKDYQLNWDECFVIGDRWSDMVAGNRMGCHCILVRTGAGMEALREYRHKWMEIEPDYIANNLEDAVQWILEQD